MVYNGNSTTGQMRMVRETECSLNVNATLQGVTWRKRKVSLILIDIV